MFFLKDEMAFKQKQREEQKAMKEMAAKASGKGPLGRRLWNWTIIQQLSFNNRQEMLYKSWAYIFDLSTCIRRNQLQKISQRANKMFFVEMECENCISYKF